LQLLQVPNLKFYRFPPLGTNIDIKVLPTAWHTTHPPRDDKYCDFEGCTEFCEVGYILILICGHAYHFAFYLN